MNVTLFLAQAFGIFFVIAGLGLALKPSALRGFIAHFSADREVIMMGGFVSLVLGIPLVLLHSLWGNTLESIVSVIVWLTFLKGVMRVLFPDMIMKMSNGFAKNVGAIKVMLWLMSALGAYLIYVSLYVSFGM